MIKALKFKWKDLKNEEVVAIPAIGDYHDFVTENYMVSGDYYNPKTQEFISCEDRYIRMLNSGSVLFHKNYLVFKEGYHEEYFNYAKQVIEGYEDKELLANLKEVSSYSFIYNTLKIVKSGVLKKERAIVTLSKYFKDEEYLNCILKEVV